MLNEYFDEMSNSNGIKVEPSNSALAGDTRIVIRGIKNEPDTNVDIKQNLFSGNVAARTSSYVRPKHEFIGRSFMRSSIYPPTPAYSMENTNKRPLVEVHSSQQLMITGCKPPPGKITKLNHQITPAHDFWNESNFECDICQKGFSSLQLLLAHKRFHTTIEWSTISDMEGLQQWKNKRLNARAQASANTIDSTFVVRRSFQDQKSFVAKWT